MRLEHRQHLQSILAQHGITETYGIEIMGLVRMLANIYEMIVSTHMREERLSGPRLRLLLHLYMSEQMGRPSLSPTELSKIQNITKNTVSSHLRSLEAQGYITRTLHASDRRQFRIQLSEQGRELVLAITPRYVSNLNQLTSDLTSEEVEQLLMLLQKLLASLVSRGDLPDIYCLEKMHKQKCKGEKDEESGRVDDKRAVRERGED
ncbi:MAG: MarR family transcriptional regulator [Chloroflexi bacterium]|nr:MarR family transcriptional regulator [Chloroflexota bacterium]